MMKIFLCKNNVVDVLPVSIRICNRISCKNSPLQAISLMFTTILCSQVEVKLWKISKDFPHMS